MLLKRSSRHVLGTAVFAAAALLSTTAMASSGGRAAAANDGNTGAPGEGGLVCNTCHNSGAGTYGALTETLSVLDSSMTPVTTATVGETLSVSLLLSTASGTPGGWGFQMTTLDGAGLDAGAWSNLSSNVQSATASGVGGRTYLDHNGTSATSTFAADWTAPNAPGTVTFYYIGNAVDGTGSTAADLGGTGLSFSIDIECAAGYEDVGGVCTDVNECAAPPAPSADLMITAVYDGPLTGGTPKGVELLVLNDIADLSAYGIGSANNGGGTDGEEYTFPADSATAGDYIYVASEAVQFANFFGFAPDYTSGSMSINGDDAVELFNSGAVIDLYGDIATDGSGEVWDFLDGWAVRASGGPSTTFTAGDWTFSGINVLDGETTNAGAATPVPVGTYIFGLACDANATCTNTPGSFTCGCNVGYEGDGFTCNDIDGCGLSGGGGDMLCPSGGDTGAVCVDISAPGTGYSCTCSGGYTEAGGICEDIDECAFMTDNCDANATCTNSAGSFSCGCNAGYTGDGITCTDVDECADMTDDCAMGETCTNTPGGWTCGACPAGTYDNSGACTPCAAGTFQALSGQTSCDLCPAGTSQDQPGQTSCDLCAAGTIQASMGQTSCNDCPAGRFQDEQGQTTCDVCAVGSAQPNPGQTSCTLCAAGTYQPSTEATACLACGAGTAQASAGQNSCDACAPGDYQDQTGQTMCLACAAGDYQPTPGSTMCLSCPAGYTPNGAQTACDDVDECADMTDNCDANATCGNTAGGFTCTCNGGFTGDGVTCSPDMGGGTTVTCDAAPVASATFTGIGERPQFPYESICDGVVGGTYNGFASPTPEDTGTISFMLDGDYDVDGVLLYNDFGGSLGQGVADLEVRLYDSANAEIGTARSFSADAMNQGVGAGPDIFTFATETGVRRIEIEVLSNFDMGGVFDQLNIREIEFFASGMGSTVPCTASPLTSVVFTGLAERALYPQSAICDGVENVSAGFASDTPYDSGSILFTFDADYDVSKIFLSNDFGVYMGQGIEDFDATFFDSTGTMIDTPLSFTANAGNQLQGNGPDVFVFAAVPDVRSVRIDVMTNFTAGGSADQLNVREIRFGTASNVGITRTCASADFDDVTVFGMTERRPAMFPIEAMCDGTANAVQGFESNTNEDSGTVSLTLTAPGTIEGVEFYSDFGVLTGQGAQDLEITLYDVGGTALTGAMPFTADALNQLQGNGPDVFTFASVGGVARIDIDILDNFDSTEGGYDFIQIREIQVF